MCECVQDFVGWFGWLVGCVVGTLDKTLRKGSQAPERGAGDREYRPMNRSSSKRVERVDEDRPDEMRQMAKSGPWPNLNDFLFYLDCAISFFV